MSEFKESFAAFVTGLAIGWLAGLSLSPVASTLATTLLALATTSAGVLPKLTGKSTEGAAARSITFVAALATGIAIGATAGIALRQEGFLGLPIAK